MIDSTLSLSLDNISLIGFDRQGNLHPLNSPNNFIWVGHASFHQLYTYFTSSHSRSSYLPYSYSSSYRLTQHKRQKLAVRQLSTLLINKILLENESANSHKPMHLDNYVDESTYPYIVKPYDYPISFSHSQNQVACVIQRQGKVGIDLELKPIPTSVCHRFFAADELAWLKSLALADQAIGKRLLWMIKEAILKRQGNNKSILMQQLKSSSLIPAKAIYEKYKTDKDSKPYRTDAIKNSLINCRYIEHFEQIDSDDHYTELLIYLPTLSLVTASKF